MPNHRMAEAQQTGLQRRPCGIIPVSALWVLCRYRHKTHATGHGSRLDREGITQHAKFGSDRYSKEELVAELGAAFLSNEAEHSGSVSDSRTRRPTSLRGYRSLKTIPA